MTERGEHTPRPWTLDSERYILAEHNTTVARVAISRDGALIVAAVNAYESNQTRTEELERSSQLVLEWWDRLPPTLRQDIEGSGNEPGCIAITRATLSKGGGSK